MLAGLELKTDIESQMVGSNQAKNAGADATARVSASILSWIKTNTDKARRALPALIRLRLTARAPVPTARRSRSPKRA
jgi:hypothetical protein